MRHLRTVFAALVLALGPHTGAVAQDALANGAQVGAWTVSCEAMAIDQTACLLNQRLARAEDGAYLADILTFWARGTDQSYISARVPLGVYFPSGFVMKPENGEATFEFVWQTCSAQLCEALIQLDFEDLRALEASGPIVLAYRPTLGADPLVFKMSFEGLGAGLLALRDDG